MSAENGSPETSAVPDAAPVTRLSNNARRELIQSIQKTVSDRSTIESDALMVDIDDPVALQVKVDQSGTYTMIWWMTAQTSTGHHRWRDVVDPLLEENERVMTSALGGGFLVEHDRQTTDQEQVLSWLHDRSPVERVHELMAAVPAAIQSLPPEPVPDYLLPPEPEVSDMQSDTLEEAFDNNESDTVNE